MVLPDRQSHIAAYGRIQEYDDARTILHQTPCSSQHRSGLKTRGELDGVARSGERNPKGHAFAPSTTRV